MRYIGLVVIPVTLGIWTAAYLHRAELEEVWFEADARVARSAIVLLEREIQEAIPELLRISMVHPAPDTSAQAVRQALSGDTVVTIEPGIRDLDAVLYRIAGPGSVAHARTGITAPVVRFIEGSAAYEVAFYLNGTRRAASDADFGPATLPRGPERRLEVLTEGIPFEVGEAWRGALVPRVSATGEAGPLAVLAAPNPARRPALTRRYGALALATAMGLIVLRILTLAGPLEPRSGSSSRWVNRFLGWAPLLVALSVLLTVAARFGQDVDGYALETLGREMSLARTLGPEVSVTQLRRITGYHATRIRNGEIQSSSLPGGVLREAVLEIPLPPGAGVESGRVGSGAGPLGWAAARQDPNRPGGPTLILTELSSRGVIRDFNLRLGGLGLVLLLLLLLYPANARPAEEPDLDPGQGEA